MGDTLRATNDTTSGDLIRGIYTAVSAHCIDQQTKGVLDELSQPGARLFPFHCGNRPAAAVSKMVVMVRRMLSPTEKTRTYSRRLAQSRFLNQSAITRVQLAGEINYSTSQVSVALHLMFLRGLMSVLHNFEITALTP
jgi:hypothetical protein